MSAQIAAPARVQGSQPRTMTYAQQLHERGYVVIPVITAAVLLHNATRKFVKALTQRAPELRRLPDHVVKRIYNLDPTLTKADFTVAGGGFSALGNPSSFHDKDVRTIRTVAHEAAYRLVFGPMLTEDETLTYQAVPDRAMLRPPGVAVTKESVHRDLPPHGFDDEMVVNTYGGWLSFTNGDGFWCCPGTHSEPTEGGGGFALIKGDRVAHYTSKLEFIPIPRGHMLIFDERLVHAVNPSKDLKIRLFLGHRLWIGEHELTPRIARQLRTQAPVDLKSGQESPMYPKLWRVNYPDKIPELTDRILNHRVRLKAMERWTVKSGKREGEEFYGIKRVMPSLLEMFGELPHPPYSPSEYELYSATRGPLSVVLPFDTSSSMTIEFC